MTGATGATGPTGARVVRGPDGPPDSRRPVAALDVDGVLALVDPTVPVIRRSVSAYGKWRRELLIPQVAAGILHALAERFDCVWVGAWAHAAHPALQPVLDLPLEPWPWIGVQFHKLAAIREFAAGRPWVWLDDSIDDLGPLEPPLDGVLHRLDPSRGIADVDPDALLAELRSLSPASGASPRSGS